MQTKVPQSCLPIMTDNNIHTLMDQNSYIAQQGVCQYEGRFYNEESQWTSTDPCTMCFCQNGNVKCDTSMCPPLECPEDTHKSKTPGECCYVCMSNNTPKQNETNIPRGCTLLGKFYSPGAVFHPFLIPNGFDTCTNCTCDPEALQVKCNRISDEKLCCKNCQDTERNIGMVNDRAVADVEDYEYISPVVTESSPQTILSEGGCRNAHNPMKPHLNGTKYHPVIESLGEYKCVTCECLVILFLIFT